MNFETSNCREADRVATIALDRPEQLNALSARMIGAAVDAGLALPLDTAPAYEARCFEVLFSSGSEKEAVQAFVEKREPIEKGR